MDFQELKCNEQGGMGTDFQKCFHLIANVLDNDAISDETVPELFELQKLLRKMKAEYLQMDNKVKNQIRRHNEIVGGAVVDNMTKIQQRNEEFASALLNVVGQFQKYAKEEMIEDVCAIEDASRMVSGGVLVNSPEIVSENKNQNKEGAEEEKGKKKAEKLRKAVTFDGVDIETAAEKYGFSHEEAHRIINKESASEPAGY